MAHAVSIAAQRSAGAKKLRLPAEPSREDLVRWLACVDVLPAAGGLESIPADQCEGDAPPGNVFLTEEAVEPLDDDDLEAEEVEMLQDPDEALRQSCSDLADQLQRLLRPEARLTETQRAELKTSAESAWEAAGKLVADIESGLEERRETSTKLQQALNHLPGTLTADRANKRHREADKRVRGLTTRAIKIGLERRVGLYLWSQNCFPVADEDGLMFARLLALGGEVPPGIAVCCDCGLVFRPRYSGATRKRCNRCHDKPRTPALGFEPLDGGGSAFWSPVISYRRHACADCGTLFTTRRPEAKACPSCKRNRNRESARRSRVAQN